MNSTIARYLALPILSAGIIGGAALAWPVWPTPRRAARQRALPGSPHLRSTPARPPRQFRATSGIAITTP